MARILKTIHTQETKVNAIELSRAAKGVTEETKETTRYYKFPPEY